MNKWIKYAIGGCVVVNALNIGYVLATTEDPVTSALKEYQDRLSAKEKEDSNKVSPDNSTVPEKVSEPIPAWQAPSTPVREEQPSVPTKKKKEEVKEKEKPSEQDEYLWGY